MRERKYRAYTPESKEMVYFDLKKAATDQYIAKHLIQLLDNNHPTGKDLLTEWTGLTDKNGVDIYEGDKIAYEELDYDEWPLYQGVVIFDSKHLMFCLEGDAPNPLTSAGFRRNLEVIGNIHEQNKGE